MNTRTALRKSILIAPAEAALRRADTHAELDEAWSDYCSGFAGGSAERRQLMGIYHDRFEAIRARDAQAVDLVRILGAG